MRVVRRSAPLFPTLGSLFAGVGGFDLAGDAVGIPTLAWSEFDPSAKKQVNQAVLAARFPGATAHGDVTGVSYADLGRPSVLTAGSPCQGFSVAGLRAGMYDHRSGLFGEFARIFVEGKQDGGLRYAVWENVPGALTANKGEDFANVLAALVGSPEPLHLPKHKGRLSRYAGLASGPLGTLVWRVLDAQYFGVAQRRQRIFAVLDLDGGPVQHVLFPEWEEGDWLRELPRVEVEDSWAIPLDDERVPFPTGMQPPDPAQVKLAEVLKDEVDERYFLSEKACKGILKRAGRRGRKLPEMLDYALRCQAGEFAEVPEEDDDGRFAKGQPVPFDWQASGSGDESFRGKSRAYVVRKGDTSGTMQSNKVEAVAVSEVEAAQCHGNNVGPVGALRVGNGGLTGGVPFAAVATAHESGHGWWIEAEHSGTLRAEGENRPSRPSNAVVCATGERAHTLTGNGFDASEDGTGRGTPIVPVASTLQGGGQRGYRIDAESAAGGHLVPTVVSSRKRGDGYALEEEVSEVYPALVSGSDKRGGTPRSMILEHQSTDALIPVGAPVDHAFTTGAGWWNQGGEFAGTLAARDYKDATQVVITEEQPIAFTVKDSGQDAGPVSPTLRAMGHTTSHANGGGQVGVVEPALPGNDKPHALTYRKVQRARSTEDDETWEEAQATNTLNLHDNMSDVRATDVVAYAIHGTQDPIYPENRALPIESRNSPYSGVVSPPAPHYRVRRLTPAECERLQGFPDEWALLEGSADSHRYRQMGNAVAVPVAAWVLGRVKAAHEGRELPGLNEILEKLPWLHVASSAEVAPKKRRRVVRRSA